VAVPIKIAGADIAPRGMASPAGADTETVLIEAGLDAAEIADLRAAGAIG
jgi:crotonobetainyl-CoA:carnitine CoA-transferase CaiB-like acyl-CoA transferase